LGYEDMTTVGEYVKIAAQDAKEMYRSPLDALGVRIGQAHLDLMLYSEALSDIGGCLMEQEQGQAPVAEYFSELEDPRRHNRRHKLVDIVVIAICVVVCGEGIELFGHSKEEWLKGFLELPHGIPSHDTFRRVFGVLDHRAISVAVFRVDPGGRQLDQGTGCGRRWQDLAPFT
jgi:hypothetical protein